MNTEQFEDYMKHVRNQTALIGKIAEMLERIERNTAPVAPNYTRPFADYPAFDWSRIGAKVTAQDNHGVSAVEWAGQPWTRRSGTGKFGKAVWFSRYLGTDDLGQKRFGRLVTFKDYDEAESLPRDVADSLPPTPPPAPTKPPTQQRQAPDGPNRTNPKGQTRAEWAAQQAQAQADEEPVEYCELCGADLPRHYADCPTLRSSESSPVEIDPLDLQRTQVVVSAEQAATKKANNGRQALLPAAGELAGDARQRFYQLGSAAVKEGQLDFQKFNELVNLANIDGFEDSLRELQRHLVRALTHAA